MIKKSQAIREASRANIPQTNKAIKEFVEKKWGLEVKSNHITNLLGTEESRVGVTSAIQLRIQLASNLLLACQGDRRVAISMVWKV